MLIISEPFCFTSRASLRIAVFLPSKVSAAARPRCSACLASPFIFASVSTRPVLFSARARLPTFYVAACAAIARPTTSASFDSRFVSSGTSDPSLGGTSLVTLRQGAARNRGHPGALGLRAGCEIALAIPSAADAPGCVCRADRSCWAALLWPRKGSFDGLETLASGKRDCVCGAGDHRRGDRQREHA